MFDLNETIMGWRHSFGEEMRSEDLDELEEHLRAEVLGLQTKELSAEEAFLVARSRIGNRGELEAEYAKVHAGALWAGRVQWMVLGFLGIEALTLGLGVLRLLLAWGTSSFELAEDSIMGVLALFQVLGLTTLLWLLFRAARAPRLNRSRMVVCAMALALSVLVFLTGRGLLWIVQSRVLTPDQLGGLFYANRMVAVSSTLLLPVYLFVVVYALERRKRVLS